MRYNHVRTLVTGVIRLCACKQKEPQNLPEAVKRQYCCAFTGHRPEKVVGSEGKMIVELRKEILKAIDDGYGVFLTGMSRGVDLWAVLLLKYILI